MDALETLLRPATRILNRNIQESTPARLVCTSLSGSVAAVRVSNTALAMYLVISDDAVLLTADTDRDPDFAICGTLLTLARVAAGSGQQAIRDGSLELIGDVDKAQAFQTLLAHAKPDIEEELSTFVGDSAAHGIGQAVRSVRSWASNARTTLGENIREYLQEESADVPSRYEFETFSRRLSTLRDDVDRLAARIDRRKDA